MTSPNLIITDQDQHLNNKMDSTQDIATSLKNKYMDRIALLAIAYFNLGCEYEHLHQLEDSLEAYERATGL